MLVLGVMNHSTTAEIVSRVRRLSTLHHVSQGAAPYLVSSKKFDVVHVKFAVNQPSNLQAATRKARVGGLQLLSQHSVALVAGSRARS